MQAGIGQLQAPAGGVARDAALQGHGALKRAIGQGQRTVEAEPLAAVYGVQAQATLTDHRRSAPDQHRSVAEQLALAIKGGIQAESPIGRGQQAQTRQGQLAGLHLGADPAARAVEGFGQHHGRRRMVELHQAGGAAAAQGQAQPLAAEQGFLHRNPAAVAGFQGSLPLADGQWAAQAAQPGDRAAPWAAEAGAAGGEVE